MKRKKSFIVLTVIIIVVIAISSIIGCSINGFKEDDFEIAITSIRIDGNKVTVKAQLKNNSWRNGLVTSSGLLHILYTDEDGKPDWAIASIALYNWIRCKQKITVTEVFELEKGKYTIRAVSGFDCNKNKSHFVYSVEKVIEV